MRRTALLIGAQTEDLKGVDNDIQTMADALERHGFTAVPCTGAEATRDGILAAYDRLIATAEPGDACFVYYSGHGGLIRPPLDESGPPAAATAPERQFIAPSDFHETSDVDFRGITSVELSVKLAKLTRVTANVAVAFDCCHAAHMTRDPGLRVRALLHTTPYEAIGEHLDRQRRRGLDLAARNVVGCPDAVRLMACEPQQSAYEYSGAGGRDIGLLTESLARVLTDVGDLPVSWSTVADLVRRRVALLASNQRPAVEGPAARLLFDTREGGVLAALPAVQVGPGRVELAGAALFDVQIGDEFAIMPAIAERADDATKLGDAVVTAVGPMTATATLRPASGSSGPAALPIGARAHRTRSAAPEFPVGLPAEAPIAGLLRDAVERAVLLRPALPDEPCAVRVRVDAAGGIAVHDRIGPLHAPRASDAEGIQAVVDNLQRQARANALRTLGAAAVTPGPFDRVSLEWGRVVGGERIPLPLSGAVLYAGENLYVRIHNGTDATVHVSLVDIGIAARISVLTGSDTSGVRLGPGADYLFGRDEYDGSLPGAPLAWPPRLDPAEARPEHILAIIISGPLDVTVLEQSSMRSADAGAAPDRGRADGPELERLMRQIATGRTRDVGPVVPSGVHYAVRGIDFILSPARPPAPDAGSFVLDERPETSVRLLTTRGIARSRRVAVRLEELVVHHNRALFGADVRVDALVLTGGGPVDEPVYHVRTERFSNVRDGERLPLDRLLMYHGPATDYLDLAVWVSHDTTGSLALSDLVRKELTSEDVQLAGVQLTSLVLTAPHAAAAVAAVGAAAVVVNVAYRLLLQAAPSCIGLYRTSLLAQEDFGIGTAIQRRRAQEFSFAYSVTEVP